MKLKMELGIALGYAFLGCAAAGAADTVHPLNIKTGQWENTIITKRSTPPPQITPESAARMTPEQRAAMQKQLSTNNAMGTSSRVTKSCLTKEDLTKSFGGFAEERSCKRSIVTSTSKSQEFHIECLNKGLVSSGTVKMEAADPEHVKGSVTMSMTVQGQVKTLEMTISAKWLGAACPVVGQPDAKK